MWIYRSVNAHCTTAQLQWISQDFLSGMLWVFQQISHRVTWPWPAADARYNGYYDGGCEDPNIHEFPSLYGKTSRRCRLSRLTDGMQLISTPWQQVRFPAKKNDEVTWNIHDSSRSGQRVAGGVPHIAWMQDGGSKDHGSTSAYVWVCYSYGRADLERREP